MTSRLLAACFQLRRHCVVKSKRERKKKALGHTPREKKKSKRSHASSSFIIDGRPSTRRKTQLHDDTAAAGLLRRIGILALWYCAPYRRDHIISCAIAVRNDAAAIALASRFPVRQWSRCVFGAYLLEAVLTGMRSRSRSSRSLLLSSVRRLSFRSAIDCFVFLI